MPKKKKPEATLRPKSEWQKYACLFCTAHARLEAVYGKAMIRCCASEACIEQAKNVALDRGRP
jgi:hypothetical protein